MGRVRLQESGERHAPRKKAATLCAQAAALHPRLQSCVSRRQLYTQHPHATYASGLQPYVSQVRAQRKMDREGTLKGSCMHLHLPESPSASPEGAGKRESDDMATSLPQESTCTCTCTCTRTCTVCT